MKLFGTDGVRGPANEGVMTPGSLVKLAQATALCLDSNKARHDQHRFTVVIGKDTRLSGYMVEASLMAGFIAMGCDVVLLGPLPTPAVAALTPSLRANLGVMISASHNPSMDNGIKFFNADGCKFSDEQEHAIENAYHTEITPTAKGDQVGRAYRLDDALGRYIEWVKSTLPRGLKLDGLKIVVDAAHGAMYKVAPTILWELGAEVIKIGCEPNGVNINENCGATSPGQLSQKVKEEKADIGIALDGDGDRIVLVDEGGTIINGDYIIGLLAAQLKSENKLGEGGVIGTVLSNGGLESYCANASIPFHRSAVGDRFVYELMNRKNAKIGGEPSGHIVLKDFGTTGDGLVVALQVLKYMVHERSRDKSYQASFIKKLFAMLPQKSLNLPLPGRGQFNVASIKHIVEGAEKELAAIQGRLIVRLSGTEPLLRLMGEGQDLATLERILQNLAHNITQNIAA